METFLGKAYSFFPEDIREKYYEPIIRKRPYRQGKPINIRFSGNSGDILGGSSTLSFPFIPWNTMSIWPTSLPPSLAHPLSTLVGPLQLKFKLTLPKLACVKFFPCFRSNQSRGVGLLKIGLCSD